MSTEKPPKLKHTPIVYTKRENDTDAKFFDIGHASWNEKDYSVKIWRWSKKGKRWSRQSEEIPIGRFLDLIGFVKDVFNNRSYEPVDPKSKEAESLIDFLNDKYKEKFETLFL